MYNKGIYCIGERMALQDYDGNRKEAWKMYCNDWKMSVEGVNGYAHIKDKGIQFSPLYLLK